MGNCLRADQGYRQVMKTNPHSLEFVYSYSLLTCLARSFIAASVNSRPGNGNGKIKDIKIAGNMRVEEDGIRLHSEEPRR